MTITTVSIIILTVAYFISGEIVCKKVLLKKLLRMNAPDHIKKRLHHLVEKFSPIKEFFKITKRIFLEHGEAIIRGVLGVIIGAGYLTLRVLYLLFWPIHLFGAILSLRRAEKEYAKKSDHPAEE